MHRPNPKFYAWLLITAITVAAGAAACLDTAVKLDTSDETDGAT